MKQVLALLMSFMIAIPAYAGECEKVRPIYMDQKAECDGLFFPVKKAQEATEAKLNYQNLLKQRELYHQTQELLKKQAEYSDKIAERESKKAELWRTKAVGMTEKYMEAEADRGTRDWIFLISGVGLTVLAGFSLGAAAPALILL